ncbi:exotoxin A [Pseudomonas aeruginosa]|nr:exotoxin A [Pseudomonas aeruginosa]
MHLIPHWIPLVASLGLLAGGSSASAAEEAFDLWNECAKACVLDLKDGVRSSRMSVDPAIADTNGQGVLHYSMVLEGGNDALKLAIDNALSITSDGLTIRLEGGVEPNKPVRYSYTRQARGSWSLNWLVPIGHEKPSNIKVFIHELNAGNQLSHMSPIYTIEMGDELLAKLARDATFFVRAHESNEMQPTLAISHAGVSVVMAQTQPRREKRWSEWASGKVLCLLDPLDGVYNYLAQQRCNLDDTWEGKIYRVLAGNPAKHDLDIKPTVISHRLHFPEGGSLAALTAHQACHLPLETFTRHRQPRGWEQLEQCGYPVQRLVALYLAARLSWNQVDQVIRNALASPGSGGDLGEAIREQPEQTRLALTLAAAENERFVRQGTGNDEAGAASADVVSLTCPVAAGECAGPADSGDALLERNYPTGAEFLGDGGDVSFSTRGTQNWTVERLLQAHRQLEERGYVFVGYHGTFLEAAQSIVFGGVRARSQDLDAIWRGFYIAGDPALAYGYAQDQEPDARGRIRNGALLRVYVPRSSLPGFYRTGLTLAAPEAAGEVERLIGHPLPLRLDAITGPEEEGGRLETILGWPLAERTVVIPSAIPTDPRNVGGDLDPSSIPDKEQAISALPDYASQPGKPPREALK